MVMTMIVVVIASCMEPDDGIRDWHQGLTWLSQRHPKLIQLRYFQMSLATGLG